MSKSSAVAKRAFDVLGSLWLVGMTSPLWLASAVAVWASSRGPVFYRARRMGRNGQLFEMYKFRSMYVGSDRVGPALTHSEDRRVTSAGRFLRRTKLDELPQLLNVIRGDMSLVGPRPEAPEYIDRDQEEQRVVLLARPGITGPTQLRYRDEERLLVGTDIETRYRTEILPDKLKSDAAYVRNRSLWGDICILGATLRSMAEG